VAGMKRRWRLERCPETGRAELMTRHAAFKARGLCGCGRQPVEGKKRCGRCIDTHKRYRDKLRLEMLAEYGGRCQCEGGCDITNPGFLAVDHIFDDGKQHRKDCKLTNPVRLAKWLKDRGWPKDRFRLLCHNCNQGREWYG